MKKLKVTEVFESTEADESLAAQIELEKRLDDALMIGAVPGGAAKTLFGQEFLEKVYEQVALVPEGRVCTYGKIAELAGFPRCARQVGVAMSRVNPEQNLPCHRIVNAKGTLAPNYAFGGKAKQKKMLESEGVTFKSQDVIDVAKHKWPDEEAEAKDGIQTSLNL